MKLQMLDLTVIAGYLLGLFVLGIVTSRRQDSRDAYFLAGRRVPWLIAGISVIATLLSTVSYLALPGEMIRNGLGFFTHLFAFVLVIPVVTRLVIPALMRLPVTSIYDYLAQRFGVPARTVGAAVFTLMRLVWMGLILYTAAGAIAPTIEWPWEDYSFWRLPALVAVMGIVTVFYTTLGGMRAVLWSDCAQFLILLGGAILIPCYVMFQTGAGPAAWWTTFSEAERTQVSFFSWDPTDRITIVGMMAVVFVWNICTHSSDQLAAQRYLSTTDTRAASRSFWVFSLANIILILLLAVVGLALFHFYFEQAGLPIDEFQKSIAEHADDVLPRFVAGQLPAGISGLLLAALLAAAMSSLSSGINSISAVAVVDLMRHQDSDEALRGPRIIALVSGIVAIAIALGIDQLMQTTEWNLVDLVERINHLFVAPLGGLFFAGIWFRRVGLGAALTGFAAGVVASFAVSFSERGWLFDYPISFMWIMPVSFVVTLGVAFLASFFFTPPSAAQLTALYYRAGPRSPAKLAKKGK